MTATDPVHTETETHTWSVNVPDHPQRADSPEYTAAKNKMNEIAAQAPGLLYGPGPFQDHHGSALWLQDSQGWFMVRNLAGIEWSAQFCVSADMRVLTADLRWIPAGEVRVGDHLAGFDESIPASGRRHWRRSVVERAEVITRPCYAVVFADGSEVRATADHLWLACGPAGSGYATAGWYRTDALVSRQGGARAIVKPVGLWSEDTSWEAGYLAAAFDGEGHLIHGVKGDGVGHGGGQQVGIVFSQRDNEMYAEVVRCLKVLGFTFREETRPAVRQVIIAQRHEVLRFLGSIRPRRLLAQFKFEWLCQFNALERVRVKEVRYVGERPVAVLTTSTGTYIAEGLAAHNCADPAKVDLLRQNAKRLYDLVAPQIKQELDPNGLLDTPITDADGVAKWTDSIFNAGVPLHPSFHIGVMPMGKAQAQNPPATADAQNSPDASDQAQATAAPGDPESAGVHHYPTPVVDIQLFKYDDFELWVTDSEGNPAAVTPVGERGSGIASVHVQYATPGSQLAQQKQQQESAGGALILPADHPLAQQAFQNQ
jgi:Family of unknown function (DUF6424)